MKNYKLDTLAVQAGWEPKNGQERVVPISMSTTFKYESAAELAKLFDLKESGYFYTRLGNPTTNALETRLAALEGGIGAIAFSSGQSATTALIMNLCRAGDHIVSSATIYGGTFNLFGHTFKQFGVDVSFIDQDASLEEIKAAVRPNTKFIFAETLSNPSVKVLDFEKFSRAAKETGVPLVVDNTFATPALCRAFDYGANIITHSLSKYSDGHACAMGGMIVDNGSFDFDTPKFPVLSTPDPSYHDLVYTKTFGKFAFLTKARAHVMRDIGNILSPMNAFLINMNLETLPLRMAKHSQNALALAQFLESHPKVLWVNYPGLESSPDHEKAKKYLKAFGGVLTFGVKGGVKAAEKLMDSLQLAAQLTHVADARTCVLHPASTTHRQLSNADLKKCGISPELVRLSAGIEDSQDLIDDFKQALDKVDC